MTAPLVNLLAAKRGGGGIGCSQDQRSTDIFKIREVDSKLLARERNDVIRQLRRILPGTVVSEVGSTAVEGVVGKQDLDFLVLVPRGRFQRTRDILDRTFERDKQQHSDHEFQGYRLTSAIGVAIQLTVKNGRHDLFGRFLNLLRADPEVRRAYNDLKFEWNLRSMNDYRAAKGEFIEKALKKIEA